MELNPQTPYPVIALLPDQNGIEDIGGTLRLGAYPCILDKTTKAYELYGSEEIHERHRHRYEVNNDFRRILTDNGLTLSGLSPDGRIVEMIELKDHPFFIATQAHPELKSRPNRPHPLFRGLKVLQPVLFLLPSSMMEQPNPSKCHRHAVLVARRNHICITDGSARLCDAGYTGLVCPLNVVAEREERI